MTSSVIFPSTRDIFLYISLEVPPGQKCRHLLTPPQKFLTWVTKPNDLVTFKSFNSL